MDKYAESASTVLIAAEQAIESNEHRERLLRELWERLDLPIQVIDQVFQISNPMLTSAAEQELLIEVQRKRDMHPAAIQEGTRARRPLIVRGMLI